MNEILVEGASIVQITVMLREVLARQFPIQASRPFYRAANTNLGTYWRTVQQFLDGGPDRAVVLVMDS